MLIESPNIQIRKITEADLVHRVDWFNDKDINKTLILEEELTLANTRKWFGKVKEDPSRLDLMILTKEQKAIGVIGFRKIDQTNRSADIYAVIGEKGYQGKGLGYESAFRVITYGFHHLKLRKIWTHVRSDNYASLAILRKIGFVQEEIIHQECRQGDTFFDVVCHGILEKEFSKLYPLAGKDKF